MKRKPQESRNQKRKRDYAQLAETQKESPSAKRARLKRQRATRHIGSRGVHSEPCGNPACKKCYVRVKDVGIVRADSEAAKRANELNPQ